MKLEPRIAALHPSLRKCQNCVYANGTRDPAIAFCRFQKCHVQREGRICKLFSPEQTKVVS